MEKRGVEKHHGEYDEYYQDFPSYLDLIAVLSVEYHAIYGTIFVMKELQRKQRIRQIMYSWPSLVIMLVFTFLLARGALGVMAKERISDERVESLEAKSGEMEKREVELKGEIARLQTPQGIEEEIREKFSVTKEGEYVAIIVDEKKKATTTEKSTAERIKNWWKGLKGGRGE